jgi:cell wall-associated NlpC family hydrolase
MLRRLAAGLALAVALASLAGCGSAPTRPQPVARLQVPARLHPPPADPMGSNEVLIRALGLVGTPYRYGGNTPEGGFDCSGLVGFVFRDAAGRTLPRSTSGLVAMRAPAVGALELEPGDLVFFSPAGGTASHIGIFVGEGRFVHAPSTGGTVRLDRLDADYWRRSFVAARRVLF